MDVEVSYSAFNSGIEKAKILIDGQEDVFELSVIEDSEDPTIKKMELKYISELLSNEISLQMSLEEAKQFNLLIGQFLRQLV